MDFYNQVGTFLLGTSRVPNFATNYMPCLVPVTNSPF